MTKLSVRVRMHGPALTTAGPIVVWCGVSALLAVLFSGRIRDWSVMTDELQYAKLATTIAETYSPLATIHGTSVSITNQLYPLLIAPLYGALPAPTAFRAAHVLNAVVMASAALPVYLLGRQILPRLWSLAAALLSVLVPWMVLTGYLMTEVAAYPAFLWAVLGVQCAIAAPSPRRDVLAVVALGIAVLARTQLAVLVLVVPLAVLGHELGRALISPGSQPIWRKLVAGTREAVRRHAVLSVLYAIGVVAATIVAVAASPGSLLGNYSVTAEHGSLLPSGAWQSAARHIDAVGIGCGLAPLLLGGGWMLTSVVHPERRREHALATLSLLTVVLLTIETTSYDLRFGGSDVVRERYLFYVVPLLLVGSAAALRTTRRSHVAVGTALITILFAATSPQLDFRRFARVSVDSPARVLNDVLVEQSGALGTGTFVALVGLLTGLVLVIGVVLAPRTLLGLLVFASLLTFSVLMLRSEIDRVVTSTGLSGRPLAGPPGLVLDWVDAILPPDTTAALVPFPVSTSWETTAIRWWDVDFWNKSVKHTYVAADGNFSYAPFRPRTLAVDWSTGEIAGTSDAPPYVVTAPGDPRFQLVGRQHAANVGLVVTAVERPYHVAWVSRGLQTDGWTRTDRPATIRVFGRPDATQLVQLRVSLRAPATAPARYRISTQGDLRTGVLAAGAATEAHLSVCVAARSAVDVQVTASSTARIEGAPLSPAAGPTRSVGAALGPVAVVHGGGECQPASP